MMMMMTAVVVAVAERPTTNIQSERQTDRQIDLGRQKQKNKNVQRCIFHMPFIQLGMMVGVVCATHLLAAAMLHLLLPQQTKQPTNQHLFSC